MRAFQQGRGKALRQILLVLLLLWAVWYARPLDFYDLTGGEAPAYLVISVFPQSGFPRVVHGDLSLSAGEPEMDAVLERLEKLRFHRNPLEVVLRFLPQGDRITELDPEKDYQIDLYAYDGQDQPLWMLRFHINGWWRGFRRELPLYVFQGQEKGRELGAFLWEMSQSADSNS
nr:hypothetical protein [uncultured Oscillibacter sp.]